jgi:hypothetical protein
MSAQDLVLELLKHIVVRPQPSALQDLLDHEFLLHFNGATYDRPASLERVDNVMRADCSYTVDVDDDAWVVELDRVACRLWVTLTCADADPLESELVVIITVRDGRFHRMWVLSWPDQLPRRTPNIPISHLEERIPL